jgi:protease-4
MATAQPGFLRRFFGGFWRLLDGTRRVVFNLLFLILVIAVLAALFAGGAPRLKDKTALVLDLRGPIEEQTSGSMTERVQQQLRGSVDHAAQLRDVLVVLDAAAKDPKIDRVLLVLDEFAGAGLPTLREVALALERVRAAKKQVIAWGSSYDQRQYFLAAHADEVYLHPMGGVFIQGYGRLRNYYKDAFDRVGVKPNVIRVGKFKNFAEVYSDNAPSKETLESDAYLYDALWREWTGGVERARKLPEGSIAKGIDEAPQRLAAVGGDFAKLAVEAKLVDGLKTRDELREMLIQRGAKDEEDKTFRQVGFEAYLARQMPQLTGDAVGVVVAQGEISEGIEGPGKIGGRSTAELIRKAREDKAIKAVVLRVDSPGGSAFGSELVRRELELTRSAGKPVVVSMGDVAASGGYWISMAADEVFADSATITGSIGVVAMLPTAEGAMDKISVRTGGYSTTWLANGYDARKSLDPRFAALVQSAIGHIYTDFTTRVAAARNTTREKIDEVGQGRVWTGKQALDRGLIDKLGSYSDALKAAAVRAKLGDTFRVEYIEREPSRFDRVLSLFSARVATALAAHVDGGLVASGMAAPVALEMQRDMRWLIGAANEVAERRKPFAGVVHCFCAAE